MTRPSAVTLMQPTLVAQPFHHEGWVYEEKVDGYRRVAHKDDGVVTLTSRQGKNFTGRFPDLVQALASLPARSFILDGEVAVFDRAHISRFEWTGARLRRGVPIAYVSRQLGHSSIQITVDLYGHFVPGGDRHHAEELAAAIEAERVAAEARVLSPHPESVPAPDGTLVAPGQAAG